jgi:hypothetical protein
MMGDDGKKWCRCRGKWLKNCTCEQSAKWVDGRREERAAIVAWLRSYHGRREFDEALRLAGVIEGMSFATEPVDK